MMTDVLRIGVDTGGTFTDLALAGLDGGLRAYKAPTTPDDPVRGVLDTVEVAAADTGMSSKTLLERVTLFVFGTTRATNAIVEGRAASTALLVTQGHPDILFLREGGGRPSLLDYSHEYPAPYVPRALTFEVPERIGSRGEIVKALDEARARALLADVAALKVEAVAVSLLWSPANGEHERRLGELIEEVLPGVPYTLSHRLNPSLREYRRTSSTAMDASLKPVMSSFLRDLSRSLKGAGFDGRLLIMTASGGVLDVESVAEAPIHTIGSGPAAAPVAGRHFVRSDTDRATAIVTDAGGTTYDVSLIHDWEVPWTRETIVGGSQLLHVGFPSVDVRSVGAGGGSVAWVDGGGLLHVGPESAGADPGPACYGKGGTRCTLTDACVVLGYIDPEYFLGGRIRLLAELARAAVERDVAVPLGMSVEEGAEAVMSLALEHMVRGIEDITLNQGIDPQEAVLVVGGGGGGLYSIEVARRLGCPLTIVPPVSATLSATGVLLSDLQADYAVVDAMSTRRFDFERAIAVLAELRRRAEEFVATTGADSLEHRMRFSVEARYPHQVWEIEVPLRSERLASDADLDAFRQDFHAKHDEVFAISDRDSHVEIVAWRVRIACRLAAIDVSGPIAAQTADRPEARWISIPGHGRVRAPVVAASAIDTERAVEGPLVIESPVTSVVIDPLASVRRAPSGSLLIERSPGAGVDNEHMSLEEVQR